MPFKKNNFKDGFKKILANTGFLFGEKAVNIALSLAVSIYVARYLGPNDYGLLQYGQSIIQLFMAIAGLGLQNIVVRDLVDLPDQREGDILGTSFVLTLLIGSILMVVCILVGVVGHSDLATKWIIIIFSLKLVLQSFKIFDYWFQSKVLSKYSVFGRISGRILSSCIKILLIVFSFSVIYFAAAIIFGIFVQSVVWVINFKNLNKGIIDEWKIDFAYAKSLLKDAWPLILSGLSVAIYMKIDQTMLKNMVSASAVGNYAVAVKVTELWYFIPMSLASSVYPSIIKSKKESLEKYLRRLQYLYDVMAGIGLLIALPMTFLSDFAINLVFGSEYNQAGAVLAIHIWSGIFVFLGVARSRWIINENYQQTGMYFAIGGAVANVVLNIWLIPLMGILGAAWATIASQALSAWLLAFFVNKTRISFYMLGRAIIRAMLIYPAIKSVKKIIDEAQQ